MLRPSLIAILAVASTPALATTYTLEPNYTQVIVWWNHLGFSEPAAQLGQGTGTLAYDDAAPERSSVTVTIPLATLNTGVAALDEHLKSDDFFDIEHFKSAVFKSTRVMPGATKGHLRVVGTLELHGITKPVTLEVTLMGIGINPRTQVPSIGFDATTHFMRSDFNLGKYVPQVRDEVTLRITTQGAEVKANAEYLRAQEAAEEAEKKSPKQ